MGLFKTDIDISELPMAAVITGDVFPDLTWQDKRKTFAGVFSKGKQSWCQAV
jgi:hypothetical protein